MAMYTTACPNCAEKLDKMYYMDEIEGSEKAGVCKWCQPPKYTRVSKYEYSKRQKRYSPSRPGGGERARAGR